MMSFIIGFTGTQIGMTSAQYATVGGWLDEAVRLNPNAQLIGEHGDCIGADVHFDTLCMERFMPRYCRPCTIDRKRAYTGACVLGEPSSPTFRNELIVKDSTILVACPKEFTEHLRSGTWTTIRRARRFQRSYVIVFPDGAVRGFGLQFGS